MYHFLLYKEDKTMKKIVVDSRSSQLLLIDTNTDQVQGICTYWLMDEVLVINGLMPFNGCCGCERKLLGAVKRLAQKKGLAVAAASYLQVDQEAATQISRAKISWVDLQSQK
jgi:hypothetical protein